MSLSLRRFIFFLFFLSLHPKSSNTDLSGSAGTTFVQIKQPKTYGSVTVRPEIVPQRLTYTWKNIDVFGQTQKHRQATDDEMSTASQSPSLLSKMRSCLSREPHIPRPRKHLLKNVSGIAYSGELLAVMGSSGAGKTTLLNVLAFRSPAGVQVSQAAVRSLNGTPVNAKQLRSRCAYIQQDDLFIGSLTAREHLVFQVTILELHERETSLLQLSTFHVIIFCTGITASRTTHSVQRENGTR